MKEIKKTESHLTHWSSIYLYFFLFTILILVYSIIWSEIGNNFNLISGFFIFLTILLFCYFNITWVFLTIIFLMPYLIGLDFYQINVGPILKIFFNVGNLYLNSFTLSCLFLLFIGFIEIMKKIVLFNKTPLSFTLFLTATLIFISFLFSEYKMEGVVFLIYLFSGFIAFFTSYFLLGSKPKYLKTLLVILASSIIPIFVAFTQFIGGVFLFEAESTLGRLEGTFPHSNTFGSFLYVILVVFLVLILGFVQINKNNKIGRFLIWIAYFLFLLLFSFFVLTYSRTAWLGFVVTIFGLLLIRPKLLLPFASLGTIGFISLMLINKVRERIIGIFERSMFDSIYGRFEIWDMAFFQFKIRPLTGYGIGSFEKIIQMSRGTDMGNVYPHNDLVRFMAEGGILGIFAYFLYMIGALYYALISYRQFPENQELYVFSKFKFHVDFKLLGAIPILLFGSMVIISFTEAPSLDFVYQIFAWTILGSWLGANDQFSHQKN